MKPSEQVLAHYGIKGMKWGVRKLEDSTKVSLKKPPRTEDAENATVKRGTVKKHGTDRLSNKEMKDVIERMNLEQQYSNLIENDKLKTRRGGAQSYLGDLLKESGKVLVTALINEGVSAASNSFTGGGGGGSSQRGNPVSVKTEIGRTLIRGALGR